MRMYNCKKASFVAGTAMAALLTFSLVAAAKLSKTGQPEAGFRAKGPAGLKIDGKTHDLSVADDGTTLTISVPLGNIDTGIKLRNDHAKDKYLEVQTYPTAELVVTRKAIKFPDAGAAASGDATGTLKIHGTSKPVTFHYNWKSDGGVYKVDGTARINFNDFGVKTPSYLGVSVKPDVEVYAKFDVKDN